ncbi:MAG: cation transporter [Microcella sp.]|nr:cation transporter [Microcella sp.]
MCGSPAEASAPADSASTAGTEFLVTGMTCGHCVSSVTEEVGAIDGVESVEVVLKKGGASRVTVTAAGAIDSDAVRAAVEEAGYQLA